jgi:PAS fold
MLDLGVLLNKIIKKIARSTNTVATIEKKGDYFYHIHANSELCTLLYVTPEKVIGKNLSEIHPPDIALERRKLYERAWKGEDVFYSVESTLGVQHTLYSVLSPVFLNGEVIKLLLYVVPVEAIPIKLRLAA